jgi:cell division protein FtsA
MAKSKKILGLDLGTTKIACAIAETDNNGKVNLIGQGISNPEGFRNGIVINLERAVESVAQAIERAEKTTNSKAKNSSIYVGISGEYVKHLASVGTVPVKNPSKGITEKDIAEVIRQAQTIRLPNDEQIIHLIPNQFIVDGQKGIRNPIGMFGFRLEVEALLVIGAVTAIENIHRVLDHLELKAESLVLQPQAVSLAVSEPEDRDLGIAIVDIGGITNISIFKDGVLRFYKTLPLGGENITKDISIGLRTPYKKAEEIKKLYGTATISCVEHDQPIIIEDISGRANKQISQRLLSSIIEPRVEEILQHVEMTLRNSCYVDGLSGGIILTGGTSMLKGIDLLAEQIFRLPVKIGTIRANGDAQSQLSDTNFTTAVGLIRYGLNGKDLYVKQSEGLFSIFALKIKELFA